MFYLQSKAKYVIIYRIHRIFYMYICEDVYFLWFSLVLLALNVFGHTGQTKRDFMKV